MSKIRDEVEAAVECLVEKEMDRRGVRPDAQTILQVIGYFADEVARACDKLGDDEHVPASGLERALLVYANGQEKAYRDVMLSGIGHALVDAGENEPARQREAEKHETDEARHARLRENILALAEAFPDELRSVFGK